MATEMATNKATTNFSICLVTTTFREVIPKHLAHIVSSSSAVVSPCIGSRFSYCVFAHTRDDKNDIRIRKAEKKNTKKAKRMFDRYCVSPWIAFVLHAVTNFFAFTQCVDNDDGIHQIKCVERNNEKKKNRWLKCNQSSFRMERTIPTNNGKSKWVESFGHFFFLLFFHWRRKCASNICHEIDWDN